MARFKSPGVISCLQWNTDAIGVVKNVEKTAYSAATFHREKIKFTIIKQENGRIVPNNNAPPSTFTPGFLFRSIYSRISCDPLLFMLIGSQQRERKLTDLFRMKLYGKPTLIACASYLADFRLGHCAKKGAQKVWVQQFWNASSFALFQKQFQHLECLRNWDICAVMGTFCRI